jgi:ribosomal protein S18 acetylase RimI-like enzyme
MAAGLAVAVDDWLGLFEIVVRPDRRRDGIGRDLTLSLLRWGRAAGARAVFLQVVNENAPAIALYESLGFAPQYTYWYRRAPG